MPERKPDDVILKPWEVNIVAHVLALMEKDHKYFEEKIRSLAESTTERFKEEKEAVKTALAAQKELTSAALSSRSNIGTVISILISLGVLVLAAVAFFKV
jgi:hypothetical protein